MPDPVRPEEKTVIKPLADLEIGAGGRDGFVPYLVIADGPHKGMRFPIRPGDNRGGRLPSNDITLEDQSISRHHFTVHRQPDGITVVDAGSKNGTYVNGERIAAAVTIGHGDILQMGIYGLRLITRAIAPEEELAPLPPEYEGKTVMMEMPSAPEAETATGMEAEEAAGSESPPTTSEGKPPSEVTQLNIQEEPERRRPRWLTWTLAGVALCLVTALSWVLYQKYLGEPPLQITKTPVVTQKPAANCPPGQKPVLPITDPIQCVPEAPQPKVIPLFLDFAASPLAAKVQFEGKDYGMTPVKVNVQLEVGKQYTADALFRLEELQEEMTEHFTFTVKETDTAIPILFRGPIGIFKVVKVPRDVELAMQGFFAHDQFHPRSMTLGNIPYGKPVYVPYGRYIVELRRPKAIGEGGQVVPDIRYRREIFITEDAAAFSLEVTDTDLETFPVTIRSQPDRAEVFIDTKPVGKTPYTGAFPLGEHTLTLQKEGYFEHTQQLTNDINLPVQLDITLKTTAAGERINEGQSLLVKGMYKEAVTKLAEVFQQGPLPAETAKAQYLLGSAFLGLNDYATAQGYFDQAKNHPDFELPAKLGLVNIFHVQGDRAKALPILVEVMLRATDEGIKTEAANTFKLLSPLKSVLYVYSDPPGATVFFNDQPVAQKTPLIVSDLGLGNYHLRIQKDGFEPQEISRNITVHEFNPVIVKLKPIGK